MSFFMADWPAPGRVRTLISTRKGGLSRNNFQSNNLAYHVNDDPQAVAANRRQLGGAMAGATNIQWLQQVHGTDLVIAAGGDGTPEADGSLTREPGMACAILTADCLPILLCNRQATQVAAVHAGWRGLAAGILVAAIDRFADRAVDILVYLGPAISQKHFEVGPEVRQAFQEAPFVQGQETQGQGNAYQAALVQAFAASDHHGRLCADLYGIARAQCNAMGVKAVYGGEFCTFDDSDRFYSYRRDGQTGRMASLIWLTD